MLSQNKPAKYFKLPRTFFYENLLKIDPFELRDELFDSHSDSEGWRLVETLLFVIEDEAKKIRRAAPYIDAPEDVFWKRYGNLKLNHREANAVSALRSVAVIRRLYALDPWEHSYDSPTVARIALEMMALIMTAIRGEFLGEYMPFIERGAAALHGSRSKRVDNLNKAIIRELKEGGLKLSAKKILSALEKRLSADPNSIVYEVYAESQSVGWYDERGKARETSFGSFYNRVSRVKKRLKAG